jgi:NMD protein affecting ribosome stability and mRNA decay
VDRFCGVCGKVVSLETFRKYGICKTCWSTSHPLFTIDKKSLFIQICPGCYRYRNIDENDKEWCVPGVKAYKEIWIHAINHFIINRVEGHKDFDFFMDFKHEPSTLDSGRKKVVWLEMTGRDRDATDPREETINFQLKYSVGVCHDCAQKRVGYHNSVLQLRKGMKRPELDKMIGEMMHDVDVIASQSEYRSGDQVTSVEEVTGGIDVKLVSKRLGKVVAGQLRKKYCVAIDESFKLTGIDKETGTGQSRAFYVVRLSAFVPGDVLLIEKSGEPGLVVRLTSAVIHLISLVSGRLEHIKPESFSEESFMYQAGKDNITEFEVVSLNEADGTMNLMRSDNFEEHVEAMKPWLGVNREGDTIKGFFFADKLYLLPIARDLDILIGDAGRADDECGAEADGDEVAEDKGSPSSIKEVAEDEDNPVDGDEIAEDEDNPVDGDEIAEDENDPVDGDEIAEDEDDPVDGDEVAEDEDDPVDGDEVAEDEDDPVDGDEVAEDEDSPGDDDGDES